MRRQFFPRFPFTYVITPPGQLPRCWIVYRRRVDYGGVKFSFGALNFTYATIKETFETDGTLGRLRAEMRTKVINVLNGECNYGPPEQPREILLINELIREYLSWYGYKYAKSVFTQESGLNSEPWTRSQLLDELGLKDTEESSKLSVLHCVLSMFKREVDSEP